MEDKEFVKIYEKIVDEEQDIMQSTSKIKTEVNALKNEYSSATNVRKQEILNRLEELNSELLILEKRTIKNSSRAKKLKSIK